MKITKCGYNYRHPDGFRINRPHGSGDYVLLVTRTPAVFYLPTGEYRTNECVAVLFNKGTPQLYGAYDGGFTDDWVHFELEGEELPFLQNLGIDFDRVLRLSHTAELSALLRSLCFEYYSGNKNGGRSAEHYLQLLFLKLSDLCQQHTGLSALTVKLTALRNEIYTCPQKAWRIDEIAEDLALSKSYLQHSYRACFGCGIKSDVIAGRLAYSKYLLSSTDYTLAVVAGYCGFESEEHFMRTFKKEVGVTPGKYRRQSISL